jgi:hypothetical protein
MVIKGSMAANLPAPGGIMYRQLPAAAGRSRLVIACIGFFTVVLA